jgi:kinetochore protein NDC80
VQFLYHQLDSEYAFGTEGMEEEIITLVKMLKYPFNLSKSVIVSCGSQHNWPKLVGLLTWMIELVEVRP